MQVQSSQVRFSFGDRNRQRKARLLFARLVRKYQFISFGTYRVVFKMNGDRVLKVPLNESGEFCNDGEGSIIHSTCATGRWIEIDGFVCVIQEYIEDAPFSVIKQRLGAVPDWVSGVDGGQVGFNKAGILKAYDFVHP